MNRFALLKQLRCSSATAVVITAGVVGLAIASCQSISNSGGANQSPATTATDNAKGLKLGALLPATGDLSAVGPPLLDAVSLLVQTVNQCGGVNQAPVSLVSEDDQTEPAAGAEAMAKLVEVDRVAGVVGSFPSSVSSAAVDVAVRNKVMLISPASTSPTFTERAKKGDFQGFWARTAPPDTYQAQALAKLAQQRNYQQVSTIVINDDYGVGLEREFTQAFKQRGGTVAGEGKPARYDPKATTFESEAALAFANKPDAVAAFIYGETGSLFLKAAYQQGLSQGVQIMLTDGGYSEDFAEQVGKTKDGKFILAGAIGTIPSADGKALAAFTKLWQQKQAKPLSAFVPHAWDAAALLVLAAEAADSNTGEGIKNQLREVAGPTGTPVTDVCDGLARLQKGEKIDYQGASGNVDIDENGDVVSSYDVWTVKDDGTLQTIGKVNPAQ
ncbi:ABC transporter substrate-binding protein [Trichocoleus sp. FACHB-591]|uniref:ABC transporter substrate-binding protein n=1 Tax=Trichocoleus sp. FACHB-591 TaxID=2692872 RepID=UPI00168959D9|nr:ABC transporter substrate-binding protein [Trichocoleus sp. FACHB-591]MBD2095205.1 ABC transporter substrate-binding protein [Trichocoleus sp. FACHB-591]